MSPAVSMPVSRPCASTTGTAGTEPSDCSTFHARLMGTAELSTGGVSKSRSRTCVRRECSSAGGSKPKRSSTICVSSLTGPSRAAAKLRSPSAARSAA